MDKPANNDQLNYQLRHYAADKNIVAMHRVLEAGADVDVLNNATFAMNFFDDDESTALSYVKLLQLFNGNLDTIHNNSENLMMMASAYVFNNVLTYLIEHNANVDITSKNGNRTALMEACENGNEYGAEILIKNGADINIEDNYQCKAVAYAVAGGSVNLVDFLLDPSEIDAKDTDGHTLLMGAARSFNPQILKKILSYGPNLNLRTRIRKETALMIAAQYASSESVSLLLTAGADVSLRNINGLSAIDIAEKRNNAPALKCLKNWVIEQEKKQLREQSVDNNILIKSKPNRKRL